MLNKIITYSFYLLFFLTPLFWTSKNFELFEYNKMMLVYTLTVIITAAWILKIINHKSLIINRTPLDIPLLLFLGANILSTIFSIDPHTSIWGYYSRSNGGLLSLISYLLLYFAFVSNISKESLPNIFKAAISSSVIISLWGIFEHFGISFSCIILQGQFSDSCWIQDVQARVFATLGQPNWMAAYLAMLIFPAIYFFLEAKTKLSCTAYFLSLTTMYLAFTFTYSRGPTLGFLAGFTVFFILQILRLHPKGVIGSLPPKLFWAVPVTFIAVNILFGSALTSFRLVSEFAAPVRPAIEIPAAPSGTQLENGGTESGQIRLVVWKGALDIFRHYPLFGTGVETFAYSYYQFRPVAHNLTSEWDFLYNKAHNEFLNYLATTGIVGLGTYIIIIITFIIFILKKPGNLLAYSLLAAYISFLVQAFFLFSVVVTALFFFLFPAIAFIAADSTKPLKLPKKLCTLLASRGEHFALCTFLYRRPVYTKLAKGIVIASFVYLVFSLANFWYADTLFNLGQRANDLGNPGKAYNLLSEAVAINPNEPFYRSELGFAAASAANALSSEDASLSARLAQNAVDETRVALGQSPNNVSYWRTAIRTYFELSSINKKYFDETISAIDKSISLAPTDPKLYLSKATILESIGKKQEAIDQFKKTIELKPNLLETYIKLAKIYIDNKEYPQAIEILQKELKILPNDPSAIDLLNQIRGLKL